MKRNQDLQNKLVDRMRKAAGLNIMLGMLAAFITVPWASTQVNSDSTATTAIRPVAAQLYIVTHDFSAQDMTELAKAMDPDILDQVKDELGSDTPTHYLSRYLELDPDFALILYEFGTMKEPSL